MAAMQSMGRMSALRTATATTGFSVTAWRCVSWWPSTGTSRRACARRGLKRAPRRCATSATARAAASPTQTATTASSATARRRAVPASASPGWCRKLARTQFPNCALQVGMVMTTAFSSVTSTIHRRNRRRTTSAPRRGATTVGSARSARSVAIAQLQSQSQSRVVGAPATRFAVPMGLHVATATATTAPHPAHVAVNCLGMSSSSSSSSSSSARSQGAPGTCSRLEACPSTCFRRGEQTTRRRTRARGWGLPISSFLLTPQRSSRTRLACLPRRRQR
mmetsp:Transcript_2621/g.5325  ORF Transcript_2621/g.5325 Transcript_2621/m.5325 type:complete len:278 (+) Transcript_2621:125-958(+)